MFFFLMSFLVVFSVLCFVIALSGASVLNGSEKMAILLFSLFCHCFWKRYLSRKQKLLLQHHGSSVCVTVYLLAQYLIGFLS